MQASAAGIAAAAGGRGIFLAGSEEIDFLFDSKYFLSHKHPMP